MLTSDFIKQWDEGKDSFATDPPNATISVLNSDGSAIEDAVVVLNKPKLEGGTLTFDVEVLEGELTNANGPASLFIDWFAARGGMGRVGVVGGVGVRAPVWHGGWYASGSGLRRGGGDRSGDRSRGSVRGAAVLSPGMRLLSLSALLLKRAAGERCGFGCNHINRGRMSAAAVFAAARLLFRQARATGFFPAFLCGCTSSLVFGETVMATYEAPRMSRRSLMLSTTAGMSTLSVGAAAAQQTTEQGSNSPMSAFSFAEERRTEAQLFLDLFGLVMLVVRTCHAGTAAGLLGLLARAAC